MTRLFTLTLCTTLLALAGCKTKEEKLQAAEDKGNTLTAEQARMVKGAGEALKKEGAEAAETVSEGLGKLVKGVGQGVQKGLLDVKVTVHPDLSAKGVTVTRASIGEEKAADHAVTAYVAMEKGFDGALELRAFDEQDREVGRVKLPVTEGAGAARYLDFAFDPRTPLLTAKRFELREVPKG